MSERVKLDYDDEEMEGKVLGGGGDKVIIISVVYPCGTVSVSSLGYFRVLVLLLNLFTLLILSLLELAILKSISRIRGEGLKIR